MDLKRDSSGLFRILGQPELFALGSKNQLNLLHSSRGFSASFFYALSVYSRFKKIGGEFREGTSLLKDECTIKKE